MAATTGFLKYVGFVGVLIMVIASIILLVYGSKIKNGTDLGDKKTTSNVFYAFGAMNMIAALAMLGIILAGCPKCPELE